MNLTNNNCTSLIIRIKSFPWQWWMGGGCCSMVRVRIMTAVDWTTLTSRQRWRYVGRNLMPLSSLRECSVLPPSSFCSSHKLRYHQIYNIIYFCHSTRNWSIPLMLWMSRGCHVLSRLSSCMLVVTVDWTTFPSRQQQEQYVTVNCLLHNIMEISGLPINPFACHIVQITVYYFYSLLLLVSPIYNIVYFCQYH